MRKQRGGTRERSYVYTHTHTRSAYRRNKKKRQKDLLGSFSIETQRSNLHYRGPLYCLLLDCRLAYIYTYISITCCPVCMCGRGREERKEKKKHNKVTSIRVLPARLCVIRALAKYRPRRLSMAKESEEKQNAV